MYALQKYFSHSVQEWQLLNSSNAPMVTGFKQYMDSGLTFWITLSKFSLLGSSKIGAQSKLWHTPTPLAY